MTESQVRLAVQGAMNDADGVRSLAREWGISPSMISDVINGRRRPGPKVLKALGLRRVVRVIYEKGAPS